MWQHRRGWSGAVAYGQTELAMQYLASLEMTRPEPDSLFTTPRRR